VAECAHASRHAGRVSNVTWLQLVTRVMRQLMLFAVL